MAVMRFCEGLEQSVLILHRNNAGTASSRHLPKLDLSRDIPVPGVVKQILVCLLVVFCMFAGVSEFEYTLEPSMRNKRLIG